MRKSFVYQVLIQKREDIYIYNRSVCVSMYNIPSGDLVCAVELN